MVGARPIIVKEQRRIIHIRNDHINVSIIVKVSKGRSPTRSSSQNPHSSLRRDIQKGSVLLVEEQRTRLLIALLKMAVLQEGIYMTIGVINVLPSIIIEVSEAGAPAHQESIGLS